MLPGQLEDQVIDINTYRSIELHCIFSKEYTVCNNKMSLTISKSGTTQILNIYILGLQI